MQIFLPKDIYILRAYTGIICSAFIPKPTFVSFHFPPQILSFKPLKAQKNLYFPGSLSFSSLTEFGSRSSVTERKEKKKKSCGAAFLL